MIVALIVVPAGGATFKGAGASLDSHPAVGIYSVTLDQGINIAECKTELGFVAGAADPHGYVEHVSDTVKHIHTSLDNDPAVASDAVGFSCVFSRIPAGH